MKVRVYHQENTPFWTAATILEGPVDRTWHSPNGKPNTYSTVRVKCEGPKCFAEHWTFSSSVEPLKEET